MKNLGSWILAATVAGAAWGAGVGAAGAAVYGPVVVGPEGAVFGVGERGRLVAEARNCGDFEIELTNGVSLEMVGIEPGRFTMGSPESPMAELGREDGERPHGVELSHGFWMGRYEVTQGQYEALAGRNPSPGQAAGPDRPVACVTWADAKAFCARLTDREKRAGRLPEGYVYSLPTEAQWEYACRAGTGSALNSGADLTNAFHDSAADAVAWYGGNAQWPQEVGTKQGNAWGLFDMHGNVAEWCADGPWEYPLDGGEETDPAGAARNGENMVRGGSWKSDSAGIRSASREKHGWRSKEEDIGFRVALVPALDRDFEYFPAEWMEFVWCPPGAFTMGSPTDEEGREPVAEGAAGRKGGKEPQREVTLTHGFWMGKHEVTRKQYAGVVGGEAGDEPDLPAVSVSWSDATNYAYRLTAVAEEAGALPEGWEFALPTEAQWEYACRALTTNALNSGEELEGGDESGVLAEVGWYQGNSQAGGDERHLHAVGELRPNAWGIYDMHGNAWEWCEDWYDEHPSSSAATNPAGPPSWPGVDGGRRAIRGGGFRDVPGFCRAAARCGLDPNQSGGLGDVGFRLVLRKKRDLTVAADAANRMELLWVKPGSLWLGSPTGETGRAPMIEDDPEMLHPVTLSRGYWLGRREVSRGMYKSVTGQVPAAMTGSGDEDSLPVNGVGRDEALDFCAELTKRERAAGRLPEGFAYTLPTEAQWEFACRAGTPSALNSGQELTDETECPEADEVAWYAHNSTNRVHGPGQERLANAWGFLDMHGNLEEWVLDWYGPYPESAVDPTGPESGECRILRGGSHASAAKDCRSAARHAVADDAGTETTGFRVALVAVDPDADEDAVHPAAQPEWAPWQGLECQWYKDGEVIEGATGTVYSIESAAEADAGLYRLEACNAFGCAKGPTAVVEVDPHPYEVVDGVHWFYEEAGADRATVVRAYPAEGELEMPAELAGRTVTAVGDEAFAGCAELEGMALPDGVTNVGDRAFAGCTGLAWVECPEGLKSIGEKAFQGTGLMAASLPGLESAGEKAFAGCAVLTECTTGAALEGIPAGMFSGCSNLLSFAVADAAGSIGADAFHSCGSLTNLHIGSNVSEVAAMAITNCGALQLVEAPIALQSTGWTTRQQLGNATVRYYGMQKVSFDAAGGTCEPLSAEFDVQGTYGPLPVPSKDGSVFFGWFREETGTRVREGDKVEPEAAVTLTAHWREGSVQVVDGVSWAFCADADGFCATVLGADPLAGAVEMPAELGGLRVAGIASNAFEGCRALQAMRIPAGVVEVGTNAFAGCRQLGTLTVPAFLAGDAGNWGDGMAAVEIVPYAAQLVTFEAEGGTCPVTKAGYEAGTNYGWLPEAEWPLLHVFDGWWTGPGDNGEPVAATNIVTEEPERTLHAHWTAGVRTNGVMWLCVTNGEGTVKVTGVEPTEGDMVMPETLAGYTVTEVGTQAFWKCTNLTSMVIAGGVTNIGQAAFCQCTSLSSVALPEGLITISGDAFCYSALADVRIPDSVKDIGGYAFDHCTILANAWLGTGIEVVRGNAFADCPALKTVWVPIEKKGSGLLDYAKVPEGCAIRYYGTQVVTFDAGEGTCPVATNGYEIGKAYGPLPEATREGWRFAGWFDADGTRVGAASTVTEEAARGLSARWGHEESVDGVSWIYTLEGDGAVVWGAEPATGWMRMPGTLGGSDVTGVGAMAFAGCTGLHGMAMPQTVRGVGDGAFAGSALESIRLPDAAEPVGARAFEGCGALETVWIGPETRTVCTNAFAGCTNLQVVWLHSDWYGRTEELMGSAAVREEAEYRFYGAFEDAAAEVTWWYWSHEPGHATIMGATPCEGEMALPATVGGDLAVTAVGPEAFWECDGLTGMAIGPGVTNIGSFAFGRSGLEAVTLPDGVAELGQGAFYQCGALAEAKLGDGLAAVSEQAFHECSNLVSVAFGANVREIGGGAFYQCASLEKVELPDGVASIGQSAFEGCVSLREAGLPDGLEDIRGWAFSRCAAITNLALPQGLAGIGKYAFSECAGLTNVVLPDSLRVLGEGAFAYCTALQGVSIPATVKEIAEWAFYGCSKMTWALIPPGVESIGREAFAWSGILNGKTPDSVTNIADGAWAGCSSMQEAWIGKSVEKVGQGAFHGCTALNMVFVHARWKGTAFLDAAWDWTDGAPKPEGVTILYYDDTEIDGIAWRWGELPGGESVVVFGAEPAAGNLSMPAELGGLPVTTIATDAFTDCLELTGMVISANVTAIGYQAFGACSNLVSVTLPEGLKTIDEAAFWRSGLTEVAVPAGVTACGDHAFSECPALAKATFGDGLAAFGQGVFMLSPALAEVAIPDSVTEIPAGAFYGCSSLANVAIPQNVTNIAYGAFAYSGLTFVEIPDAVRTLDDSVFWGCPHLLLVYLGRGVESVGAEAFAECPALREVWLDARWRDTAFLDGTWGEGGAPKPDTVNLRYYGDVDYYVSADGDDANDGLSPATAKREISAAMAVAGPRNTVHVGPGTYGPAMVPQRVNLVSDAGAEKTVIRGAEGERCLLVGAEAVVKGFTLRDGDATGNGGGARLAAGARLERCIIRDCKTTKLGGAVAPADNAARRKVMVQNCLIVGNEAGAEGGAAAEGVILAHCTVVGNTGTGVRDCAVGGSIVWGNTGAAQAVNCVVEYSLCEGAEGEGNIEDNPRFVGGGDWRLQGSSPCIDAATVLAPPVTDDLDGAPRPMPKSFGTGAAALPDMGCYEFAPKALFVSQNGTGKPPYDSWANAASNLQSAVDAAVDGDIVVVDAGTYGPVSIGSACTVVSLRGAAETVIDAQGASRAVDLLGGGTLEGFTIVNGSAEDCAGILAENGSTVRDVTVSGCNAAGMGGGVCLYGGSTAENVTVAGNTAAFGGGFLADGESTVARCTIVSNTATRSGGGAWIDNRSILRDSTVLGNTADECGGGVRLGLFSQFRNNLVKHNRATTGGGVYAVGGDGRDSVIAANTADNASALWLQGDLDGGCDAPAFWNLTIVGNGGGAPVELRDNAVLGNTIVCYNTDNGIILNDGAEATTCWTDEQTDPGFVEPDGPVEPGDRDIHLKDGAPCIGAGTVVLPLMADGYDIDGQPRIVQTLHEGYKVEIGADSATLDCIATPTAGNPSYVWRVVPGSYLQLESTPSLYGIWNAAAPPATVTNTTWTFTPAPSAPTRLFYRLLWIR